jgi:hypothetical protein
MNKERLKVFKEGQKTGKSWTFLQVSCNQKTGLNFYIFMFTPYMVTNS